MSDGSPLFDAAHGNVAAAGSGITVEAVSDGRRALRGMKGLDGVTPINAAPRFILAPAALETDAEKVVSQIQAATVQAANPFAGNLSVVIDPRLDAVSEDAWYLVADPNQIELLEFSYLEAEPGPQTESRAGFDVDGVEVKVRLDFGGGAIDWRGGYFNSGV